MYRFDAKQTINLKRSKACLWPPGVSFFLKMCTYAQYFGAKTGTLSIS